MREKAKIGDILVQRYGLSPADLQRALQGQGRTLQPLVSTCIELGLLRDDDGARALGEQFGVPSVSLPASHLATEPLKLIPRQVAESHRILPLGLFGGRLRLAMAKPDDRQLLDEVSFASGYAPLPFVAPRAVLDRAIGQVYDARERSEPRWRGPRSQSAEPRIEVLTPPQPSAMELALPAESDTLQSFPQVPTPAPPATDRPRVLAVDDEPEILEMVQRALGSRGMEVHTAGRGRLALERLRSAVPDIILLDAMLPEIHGFELCQQIKGSEHYRHIPVIIISAIYTGWNFIQDVKRIYGADDYITKPFKLMEVVKRVEDLLAKTRGAPRDATRTEAAKHAAQAAKGALEKLAAGDVAAAMQLAEKAVKADPFDARSHFVLGNTLQRAGRIYEAISEYERVVELAPNQFNALKNLAALYERQGFKAKAVEMWTRALEQSPSEAVRKTIKAHLIDLL
jgi:DNA-binding response OmpR family regulator